MIFQDVQLFPAVHNQDKSFNYIYRIIDKNPLNVVGFVLLLQKLTAGVFIKIKIYKFFKTDLSFHPT